MHIAKQNLIEKLAAFDDDFMIQVLEGETPSVSEIKRVIRKAVLTGEFFPVFCGSAYKNKGIQPLLDGVVDYLPSPLDVPPAKLNYLMVLKLLPQVTLMHHLRP